jgi:hypothetical protein
MTDDAENLQVLHEIAAGEAGLPAPTSTLSASLRISRRSPPRT